MLWAKSLCCIMSLILAFLSNRCDYPERMHVDVTEQDGMLVLWKEDECLYTDKIIKFKFMDIIPEAYVSLDNGITYMSYPYIVDNDEIVIRPEQFSEQICVRFISNESYFGGPRRLSRQFRIKFINGNTFTET